MLHFFRKYKFALLAAVAVTAVLVIAFVSGGGLSSAEAPHAATPAAPAPPVSTAATASVGSVPSTTASSGAAVTAAQTTGTTAPSAAAASADVHSHAASAVPAETAAAASAAEKPQATSVPADKPQPVEPQEQTVKEVKHRCTISVSCAAAWERRAEWAESVAEVIPENGVILQPVHVTYYEGESVFDVLQRVCKSRYVPMEFTSTPLYNTAYIEGIGNLYEFDCGAGSGWMYKVNGWFPNYGCSRYAVRDGDVIEWLYTCNLGRDIGGENIKYTD